MTTFTESFNKTDSSVLGPDLTWTELAGNIDVVSNAADIAVEDTRCIARAEHDTGSADMYAEMVVSALGTFNYLEAAVLVRLSADGSSYYALRREYATSIGACYEVVKVVSGVETVIKARTAQALALPETWRLGTSGTMLTVKLGGATLATIIDGSVTSGSFAGIGGYRSVSGTGRTVRIDSVETGSLAVTPTPVTATLGGTLPALTASLSATSDAPPPADAFTSHFDGASLPAGWSFSSPLGDGSVTVANSRATLAVPATTHDSIAHPADADQSVGIAAPVPDHGGDIDVAVQIDSDFTDQIGQGINLLATNAAGDGVRFAIYMPDDTDDEYPSVFAYSRAGGVGAAVLNETYSRYMTGCPSFLRMKYTAATGVWEFLTSSDGVTWVGDWSRTTSTGNLTITRSFTADTFKVGVSNVATTMSAASVAVQRVVDLLTTGVTDLRESVPDLTPTTVATLDGTVASLPAPWTNDSAGTDTITFTGTAIRLTHDATQDADTGARAAIGYTGTRHPQWGILAKISNPDADNDCYLTISASNGDTSSRDQYRIGGGYGLEVQSGAIRRPIRIDDNADATNAPVAPFPTDLNETPYYHLASHEAEYDLSLGGVRWFRLERLGGRYRVKEWADGSAEPATWNLFDGQDQVIEDDLGPYLSISHNDIRTGLVKIDVHSVEFYSLAAAVAVTADLAGTLPALTGALAANATATADLTGTLPALTATLSADATVTGALAGTLAPLAGSLAADATVTGQVAATLPALTGSLDATVTDPGTPATATLNATLPALTAQLTASATVQGSLAGTLPAITGHVTAAVGDVVAPALSAVLPALTGSLVLNVTTRATLAATLPALYAALTATSDAPPGNLGTPVANPVLTLTSPASTLTLTSPTSTLALD